MTFYVNITGNLAVGCTTLALQLGRLRGWHVCLERDVESPFLKAFYEDPARWAFQNQVYFVTQSLEQYSALLADPQLANATVVQDYTVYDPVEVYAPAMAELGALRAEELAILERLFRLFTPSIRPPDVLVYLTAPLGLIFDRVKRRARPTEQAVDMRYLEILQHRYDRFIRDWSWCPVVTIDSRSLDVGTDEEPLRAIGDEIQSHFASRMASRG